MTTMMCRIKKFRLRQIEECCKKVSGSFTFIRESIADKTLVSELFVQYQPQIVVNLAAQAGVRYSIENPDAYIESNLIGFYNILEACRHSYDNGAAGVAHLVYASSSSVYGSNKKIPYATEDKVDNPVSLYAATKKSDELLAYAYANCTIFLRQDYVFLQCMVRQGGQIWHILDLQTSLCGMRQ